MDLKSLIHKNPQMFIGMNSWDKDSMHHILYEAVWLAVSEISLNASSQVSLIIEMNGSVTISDDGRGLPIEPTCVDQSKTLPAIEHVLTWYMNSNPNTEYYRKFGYLTHIGTIMSYVAESLSIETVRDEIIYKLIVSRGETVNSLKKIGKVIGRKGTHLNWHPDTNLFIGAKFDSLEIKKFLQGLKVEFPKKKLILEEKQTGLKHF